jgi:hypothetical protein
MEHHAGFETTAHIGRCQQHYKSFCHPTIGAVIDAILDTPQVVRRIDITPKLIFKEETIHTENGMRINISKMGIQIGLL